jgi:TonB family protein
VEIKPYSFAIEGSRTAGEPVMVTVIDFDENLSYVLDLGNGVRQRASQRNTFIYPAAGSYEVRLIAYHPSGSSSQYRRRVDILPAPAPAEPEPAAGARIASSELKPLDVRRSSDPLPLSQPSLPLASPVAAPAAGAAAPASESGAILFAAEVMPSFPGGEEQMRKFISENVSYPSRALSANAQGRVIVRFVVRADGSISDVSVMKGIGYGCDEEAVRVVRSMPKWNPGIHEGRQVAVQRSLSIQFVALN